MKKISLFLLAVLSLTASAALANQHNPCCGGQSPCCQKGAACCE